MASTFARWVRNAQQEEEAQKFAERSETLQNHSTLSSSSHASTASLRLASLQSSLLWAQVYKVIRSFGLRMTQLYLSALPTARTVVL